MGKKGSDDENDSCVLVGTSLLDLIPGKNSKNYIN
jgi:hypothetical protein